MNSLSVYLAQESLSMKTRLYLLMRVIKAVDCMVKNELVLVFLVIQIVLHKF